jgi:hypothetical protein
MTVNIIIGKMYEGTFYYEPEKTHFIAYVFQDEQNANNKLAELSQTLIEHNKTNPLNFKDYCNLSPEEDDILSDKYQEWQKINPFPQFQNGEDIDEFFIEQHEVL